MLCRKIFAVITFSIFVGLFVLSVTFSPLLSVVVFCPLLWIVHSTIPKYLRVLFIILGMFWFVVFSTQWLYGYYSLVELGLVHFFTAVLLSIPLLLYLATFQKHKTLSPFLLFFSWIVIEYCILKYNIALPFYILGHYFYDNPEYIQYYEYTGVLGGSLWVLSCNITVFHLIYYRKLILLKSTWCLFVFTIPLLLSYYLNNIDPKELTSKQPILLFHTNASYDDKNVSFVKQICQILSSRWDSTTKQTAILPESTIYSKADFANIENDIEFHHFSSMAKKYPNNTLLVGITTTHRNREVETFFRHNSCAVLKSKSNYFITKDILVPFEEEIPFYLRQFFSLLSANMKRRSQNEHTIQLSNSTASVYICYEGLFGEFVSKTSRYSDFLIILTNEQTINHSELGTKQYLGLLKMRAIEQRKWLAKSSNSGITAIVNPYGNIQKSFPSKTSLYTLSYDIPLSKSHTFYSKYGDFVGLLSLVFLIIITTLLIIIRTVRFCKTKQQIGG